MAGIFDATLFLQLHRLPELYCGFTRRHGEGPTLYPVACDPQAWAAGSVFLFLQACLGLRVDAIANQVTFDRPMLPDFLPRLRIRDLSVGSSTLDLIIEKQALNASVNVLRKDGDAEVIVKS